MQELIVAILFISSLVYLGIVLSKSAKGDAGCSSNCGCEVKKSTKLKAQR